MQGGATQFVMLMTICTQNGAVATYVALEFVFCRFRLRLHDGAAARLVLRTDEDWPRKRPSRVAGCVSSRKERSRTGLSSHVSGDVIHHVQCASHTHIHTPAEAGIDSSASKRYQPH